MTARATRWRRRSARATRPTSSGRSGIGGAEAFHGQWLDLTDLIAKNKYDLSQFPSNIVDIYKLDEGQVGIPFAIYPSALFYKRSLFEEANLEEPPHKYGDQYTLDGKQVEWNYDTAREVALRLTVDKAGKDATEAGFDPKSIVQYGFEAAARRPSWPGRLLWRRVRSPAATGRSRSPTRG